MSFFIVSSISGDRVDASAARSFWPDRPRPAARPLLRSIDEAGRGIKARPAPLRRLPNFAPAHRLMALATRFLAPAGDAGPKRLRALSTLLPYVGRYKGRAFLALVALATAALAT